MASAMAITSCLQDADTRTAAAADAPREPLSIVRRPHDRHARAARLAGNDVPWVSTVRLPWGLELRLLNISSTGVLLESGSRLTQENVNELTLCGLDTNIVVGATFVRSEVAFVNGLGVKYHIAATFERRIDLLPPAVQPRRALPAAAGTLTHLLTRIAAELETASPSKRRAAFERGVRDLVAAREVRIRESASASAGGEATVCFDVRTAGGVDTVLEATFERGTEPTREVLRLLRAAAGLAGVILEFEAAF
jgi:hypothetical protein